MTGIDEERTLTDQHTAEAIGQRIAATKRHYYLGDFVLGAVDGTVTTFAIVAGAAGAGLSNGVAFVLGMANVVADGFSMAVSNYLKSSADRHMVQRFRKIEEMHIERIPEGEREEVRQIFFAKGFRGAVLDEIVEVITKDRKQWVDTMLTEEWGLQIDLPSPVRAALVTFVAFVLAGLVPLVPLFFASWFGGSRFFEISAGLTALTFVSIGLIRGRLSDRNPLPAALETLLVGGTAAGLAYAVGRWLQSMAHG